MTCSACNAQLNPGEQFCKSCGRQIIAVAVPKKKMSGCLIALMVVSVAVVGVLGLGYYVYSVAHKQYDQAHTPAPGFKWRYDETVSQMDHSKTLSWYLEADNEVQGWLQKTTPTLWVQCGKKIEVYVDTGLQSTVEGTAGRHTVRIKYDDGAPLKDTWHESQDGKALFAPNGSPIAKKLLGSSSFAFEFTPFNAADKQVALFDVKGFKEAIAGNKACSAFTAAK